MSRAAVNRFFNVRFVQISGSRWFSVLQHTCFCVTAPLCGNVCLWQMLDWVTFLEHSQMSRWTIWMLQAAIRRSHLSLKIHQHLSVHCVVLYKDEMKVFLCVCRWRMSVKRRKCLTWLTTSVQRSWGRRRVAARKTTVASPCCDADIEETRWVRLSSCLLFHVLTASFHFYAPLTTTTAPLKFKSSGSFYCGRKSCCDLLGAERLLKLAEWAKTQLKQTDYKLRWAENAMKLAKL